MIDSAMVQGDDVFISQFSALEAKVLRAVQVIHNLRNENERLKSELDELRRHIQELNSAVDAASTAAQEAERWKAQIQEYESLKMNIGAKITHLLSMIDSLPLSDQ